MKGYEFIKDYKENDALRRSFNALANSTFGIDFESWYQQGFWNGNYVCYSFAKDGEIVSNVSVNRMELVIEGRRQKAIQIGTVMTRPDCRRQGLAFELMRRALEDFDAEYDLYYLAADSEAVPLYEKCGFRKWEENRYTVDLSGWRRIDERLRPVPMPPAKLLKIKGRTLPLSETLSAVGDEHVLMFYYTAGFKDCIYEPIPDVFTIHEIEGSTLNLYDVLSPQKVCLETIIESIADRGVETVVCHFTPDSGVNGLSSAPDETSNWMVRSEKEKTFPANARYPRISQT